MYTYIYICMCIYIYYDLMESNESIMEFIPNITNDKMIPMPNNC